MKEKRINRIIKSINNYSDDVNNVRTMKVAIDIKNMSQEMKEKLDILLDDADNKRREVLTSLMNIFYENPIDLIEPAGKTINITKNNINVEKVENAISPINGYSIYKNEEIKQDKNGKDSKKITYFCVKDKDICYDKDNKILYHNKKNSEDNIKQDIRGIIVKLEKDKEKEQTKKSKKKKDEKIEINNNLDEEKLNFVIDKFSSQNFYNYLYSHYAKGNSYKDYASARFYEDVLFGVAGEVCSFLDKYYTIQKEIQNTIASNLKNTELLDKDIKITSLPTSVSNKQENDEYNTIVKQNNVLINLAKQKYESETKAEKDDNYKKRYECFKPLKGFPSFPLVEKQHEIKYSDLDVLLKAHIENAINWWNTINNEQMQNAMAHFCNRIVYKLFKYYYNLDDVLSDNKNHEYILNSWKSKYINDKSPIEIILERIDKKIEGIQKYLEIQKQQNITDKQSQKQLTEWLRGKSLIVFEYLRQRNDKIDFANARGEFDLKSSMNTGIFAKDESKRNKVFEISGFSNGKKACILVKNLNESTKTGLVKNQYSLAFNVSKSNGGFSVDIGNDIDLEEEINDAILEEKNHDNSTKKCYITLPEYKKDENGNIVYKKDENGNFKLKKNGQKQAEKIGDYVKIKNISFDKQGTFVLPLNFGKRYAREYLYNEKTNFDNLGETLNNARIIKQYSEKDKEYKYFVAITFTKLKGKKAPAKDNDIKFKAIIGVDRGNVLPVAITITDLYGKIIEQPQIELCKDFAKKHKEIEELKRQQSSKLGQYEAELKKKAKNFSKATIEKIGAELLYYATKHNALIVLEDLNREFGIKQMMATNQYTKLEDYLTRKLKENGLIGGNIVVNTRSGLLGKVVAKYTSKTCSNCGFVASSEKLKNVPLELKNIDGKDIWFANLDGKQISLDIECERYNQKKGHKEIFNANEEITNLKQKNTKKNEELIEKILLNALNPRKTQAEYICPICGHTENADQQASLNIARRWLFIGSPEYKEYKEKKKPYWKAVEDFCKRKKEEWNQNN